MSYRAAVVTCSDRASNGTYEDRSGPVVVEGLAALGYEVAEPVIVPDDRDEISRAVLDAVAAGARLVVTTGGTGVGPRDVTVEATRELIAYEVPGIMEQVRRLGSEKEPRAVLSRGIAGVTPAGDLPRALVINAPGSTGGARDTVEFAGDLFGHILAHLDENVDPHPGSPA